MSSAAASRGAFHAPPASYSHVPGADGGGTATATGAGAGGGSAPPGIVPSASYDWGLVLYLCILAGSVLWLLLSVYRAYARRRNAAARVPEIAARLDKERREARERQQALLREHAAAAAGATATATGGQLRQRRHASGRPTGAGHPGTALGADPQQFEEASARWGAGGDDGESKGHPAGDGRADARARRARDTAEALKLAGELALRWNEGALPQPPPLSSFAAHAHTQAVAGAPRVNRDWERTYRRGEMADQDAAYRASVEQDRARIAAQRAAEEARRAAAAEAAAKQAAEEEAARRAAEAREVLEAARAEARALAASRVGDEPDEADEEAFPVMVRLPDGSRLQRRFRATDTLQLLVDWVHSSVELGEQGYSLYFGFPSKVLWAVRTDDEESQCGDGLATSLHDANVRPRETLHLRYLSEEGGASA